MLVIRKQQMQSFAHAGEQADEAEFVRYLLKHYAERFAPHTDVDPLTFVREVVGLAKRHRLADRRDYFRYLALAAEYGAGFESDPQLVWMRCYLDDESVPSVSARLSLLLDECIRRRKVETVNQNKRRQFLERS